MKNILATILFVFIILLSNISIAQPSAWLHEYRFNFINENGDKLNCDSLINDDISFFEFENIVTPPHYDTIYNCFTFSEDSWSAIISFTWIRKKDTMIMFFEPIVGFSDPEIENKSEIDYYSFDSIRFEKGSYWIRSPYDDNLNNTWYEKYQGIIETSSKGMGIHYNWTSLNSFKVTDFEQKIVTKFTNKININCY